MKKSFKATLLVLSLILVMSFTVTGCFHFWFFQRSYSMTNCLTESITDDMDIYDIAKHYRDGGATVAVVYPFEATQTPLPKDSKSDLVELL